MVDIQSPTAEIRRGKKKKIEERNYRMKILWSALLHRATIINYVQSEYICLPSQAKCAATTESTVLV